MKTSERFQWIFAAAFLLCGLPLVFIDKSDVETGQFWAGLAVLFLALFAFCLAHTSWQTGDFKIQHFTYNRKDHPRRFMATLLMIVAAACGTLITALWFLFFK